MLVLKCLCVIALIHDETTISKMKPLLDKQNPKGMSILSIQKVKGLL